MKVALVTDWLTNIGGGEKVLKAISETRMIPEGSDAISPAPHHDIYSIEDLQMLIHALKEATNYQKPISVKISAVHNAPAIASGMVRAGADIILTYFAIASAFLPECFKYRKNSSSSI